MTATMTEYPYKLWHHNGQPLAQSVAAAIASYEAALGVSPNLILAPLRDAARIQEVTTVTVHPDRGCLPGHIMVAYREGPVA